MSAPTMLRSIQGEAEEVVLSTFRPAEEIDVDNYVAGAPEGVLECRARGRHRFPSLRKTGLVFRGATSEGYLIRKVRCLDCNMCDEVQHWEPYAKRFTLGGKRKSVTRLRRVNRYLAYVESDTGFKYAAPAGGGRILSRQVTDSVASTLVSGMTPSQLLAEAREGMKANTA